SQVRDKLSAFVDGETSPPMTQAIERHLRQCESCRCACGRLREVASIFAVTGIPPVPDNLARTILNRVADQMVPDRIGASPARRIAAWRGLAVNMRVAAAVALVVGLSAGAFAGRQIAGKTTGRVAAQSHPRGLAAV